MNQFNTSLWGDEAFSAILSMKSIPQIIKIIINDTSPPLYNITEHIWFQTVGSSEVAIRSLSFLYYCLAILFVYKIGSFLWDRKTGLLAATLSFLNPFFFIYAFEGRMYSIMSLGVAASTYFFIRLMFLPKNKKGYPIFHLIGYIIATSWALYSHHFAIFVVFIQGLWFLYTLTTNFKAAKWIFLGFLGAALLYSPWLYPLYRQTRMVAGGFWLGRPTLEDLISIIADYLATGIKHPLSKPALVIVIATLLIRNWTHETKKTLFVLSWFLGPIVFAWVLSQKFQSIFYNRYLLYTIPGIMLTLASSRRRLISAVFLGIIIGLFIKIDYRYFTHPTKRPFRELAAFVLENKRGDDYLINWNSASHHLWETKYYGIPAPIYLPENSNLPFFVGTALMEKDDIVHTIPKKVYRVGVITSGSIDEIFLPGYTEISQAVFGDLKFIWLQKRP